jgi:hydrogenase maturation protein HypF
MLATATAIERLRLTLCGAVQGVGFRPFVFRLATQLDLRGWVRNSPAGLVIDLEGPSPQLAEFLDRLDREKPSSAVVLTREINHLAPAGYTRFEIAASDDTSSKTVGVQPDLATCPDCLRELCDPHNRRFGYPFINCTQCGPRFSIVEDIPYDRPNTTMRRFEMCSDCLREYRDPRNRRFHAQPNACDKCGPHLDVTIEQAAQALRDGRIVALKGIGGFHLLVDARNDAAVEHLRRRKHREAKPLAVMMPSIEMARQYCSISAQEAEILESPGAPIVLLTPAGKSLASAVSSPSPYLGVLLPYTPLHHLLLEACGFPVVATSGNRSEEPIATSNDEAQRRLDGIADVFLMHDRPIARPCDDSVVRCLRGRESVIRRARGYAPLPLLASRVLPPILAVGGHLKNTVAIAIGRQVVMSQHIGDLDTVEARDAFEQTIRDLCRLYRFDPEIVACDLHPDYASTRWAKTSGRRVIAVQHHLAHVASCVAENDVRGQYLGVAWDGAGLGLDGAIWGSEFFLNGARVAHLRPFRLPGGEAAIHQGWRSAASLRFACGLPVGNPQIERVLASGVNSPWTTSAGRLFDAVAAMTGLAQENAFEGHAAMLLERAIGGIETQECYALPDGDWRPLIAAIEEDVRAGTAVSRIAVRFHNALVGWIVDLAVRTAVGQVVLSGGVFQNRYLTERTAAALESRGLRVYTHQRVPANDGGLSLGQIMAAEE